MGKRDGLIKSLILVTFFSLLGKLTGFIRETIIATYYGAGRVTDAYFVAHSLPSILFAIIGAGMGLVFVPMYIQKRTKDPEIGRNFASNIVGITFLVGAIISILGIALSKPIISLIAPSFKGPERDMAIDLTRIMFPMFLFISLSFIMTGLLQSHGSFLISAMISIPSNVMIILGIILFSKTHKIYALGLSTLLGAGLQLLIQLPSAKRKAKWKLRINMKDPEILAYGGLILPMILGTAIDKINILVDNILASSLEVGSISAISYATKLLDFSEGVTIGAILTVLYPRFATMKAQGDHQGLAQSVEKAIINITRLVLPVTAIFLVLGRPIVKLVFERGAFQGPETNRVAYALIFYSLGMWGAGARHILSRLFYTIGDTKTPMGVSICVLIANICLNFLLIGPMGIGGLGLATSLSGTLGTAILLFIGGQRLKYLDPKRILEEGYKIILVTSLMAWPMILLKENLPQIHPYMGLGLAAFLGLAIYFASYRFLGIDLPILFKRLRSNYNIRENKGMDYIDRGPVSVVIPCYRCSGTIKRAVASVWKQTLRPREIILIEDCSQDNDATKKALKEIKFTYPPSWVKIIYLEENGGPANARNAGWDIATQKYIAFLDADDAWHPQKIEIQLKAMEIVPHISISGHGYEYIKGGVNERVTLFTYEYYKEIGVYEIGKARMLISNRLATSSVMLKRRWIEERFPEDKYYSEDYHLWLHILMAGHRAIRIEMPLYYIYREGRGEGLSSKLWEMEKGEIDSYLTLYKNKYISLFTLIALLGLSFMKYMKRSIYAMIH